MRQGAVFSVAFYCMDFFFFVFRRKFAKYGADVRTVRTKWGAVLAVSVNYVQ